jgi:hypothetical protein
MAYMDSPEQGAKDLPIADVTLKGNDLSFKVPISNGTYSGKLVASSISGKYTTAAGSD